MVKQRIVEYTDGNRESHYKCQWKGFFGWHFYNTTTAPYTNAEFFNWDDAVDFLTWRRGDVLTFKKYHYFVRGVKPW